MKHTVKMEINGSSVEREVEDRTLLVHFLREDVGLTGTNVGCETSLCGACTVLVDGECVKSCTQLALQADGCSVRARSRQSKHACRSSTLWRRISTPAP